MDFGQYCDRCMQHWSVHNDDGSCIIDDRAVTYCPEHDCEHIDYCDGKSYNCQLIDKRRR